MLSPCRKTPFQAAKTFALSIVLTTAGAQALAAQPIADVIDKDFQAAAAQYRILLTGAQSRPGFPRTVEGGALVTVGTKDWTAGFFPGALWYLFEATGDQAWKKAAIRYTGETAPAKFDKTQHDLGFMLGGGYGNGFRLTGDPAYRDALLAGATTLITRFNPKVGAIQSWDVRPGGAWAFPVIVDNMMNLELLMWAAKAANEPRYREIAIAHADTTLHNHFRPDNSSFHLVDYDPQTGAVRARVTVQGFADGSSWARGQAWGLYGYTMMYRETKKPEYLAQARRIADFFMNHPRLPADAIPYWDFDDTAIPNAPRDASSAAITSSALLELATWTDAASAARYRAFAERQLRSLSSSDYLAAPGTNGGFLLKHATGHKPAGKEIDVPLNYADYYFLEALLRLRATLVSTQ
jgi:rhamnogalacturonyl hydrolase YesR